MSKYQTGVVLGGGGTRGFAHLGVLQALSEYNIYPDIISGVSAGSIVGSFIASGYSPLETKKMMADLKFGDLATFGMFSKGLLSLDKLEALLEESLPSQTFSRLDMPLYIAASNLNSGEIEYINSGDLVSTVKASSSIPVLFSPVEIDGQLYVDGGILDNVPISPLKDICKHIITVNIMPLETISECNNLIEVAVRSYQMSVRKKSRKYEQECDIYLEIEGIQQYRILQSGYADELFELGYNYCHKKIEDGEVTPCL